PSILEVRITGGCSGLLFSAESAWRGRRTRSSLWFSSRHSCRRSRSERSASRHLVIVCHYGWSDRAISRLRWRLTQESEQDWDDCAIAIGGARWRLRASVFSHWVPLRRLFELE